MDPDPNKLEALSARIKQAGSQKRPDSSTRSGSRVGFDFVGSIIGAGLLGGIADHFFGTSPWCLMVSVLLGFASGIWSAWRSMQSTVSTTDKKGKS